MAAKTCSGKVTRNISSSRSDHLASCHHSKIICATIFEMQFKKNPNKIHLNELFSMRYVTHAYKNHKTSLREIPETVWHKSGVLLPRKSEIPSAHKSSAFQQKSLGRCSCTLRRRRSVPLLNIPISVTTKSFCNRSPQGTTWENVSKVET